MSVLIGLPSGINPGTTTGTITLSPSTLISQFGITGFFATSTNWSQVSFTFDSPTGGQYNCLTFHMPTLTSTMGVSSTAILGIWTVRAITIVDNDFGEYVIHNNGSNMTEFNLNVPISTPLIAALLHYDPSLANGGTTNYAAGTIADGHTYWETVNGATYAGALANGGTTVTFQGTGIGSDPYRVNSSPGDATSTLTPSTVVPGGAGTVLGFMYWARIISIDNNTDPHYHIRATSGDDLWQIYGDHYYSQSAFGSSIGPIGFNFSALEGAWHLISVYRDLTARHINIYIDGALNSTVSGSWSAVDNIQYVWGFPGGFSSFPHGDIGDVWVFHNALADADQLAYYNATKATYGL